jgi:2'-5' RNA ligase
VRLFLAVFPPPSAQALAAEAIEKLRRPKDGVSWVAQQNLHYTLRFLGEVDADGATRAEQAARETASGFARFGVRLGPPGAFPAARRARVIWLGLLEGVETFARLAAALEAALERHGFPPEHQDFSAHLTLGRVREPGRDWTADLLAVKPPGEESAARFAVSAIAVVSSDAQRYRPRFAPGAARRLSPRVAPRRGRTPGARRATPPAGARSDHQLDFPRPAPIFAANVSFSLIGVVGMLHMLPRRRRTSHEVRYCRLRQPLSVVHLYFALPSSAVERDYAAQYRAPLRWSLHLGPTSLPVLADVSQLIDVPEPTGMQPHLQTTSCVVGELRLGLAGTTNLIEPGRVHPS